jgi:urease subunit beta
MSPLYDLPGETVFGTGDIEANAGKEAVVLMVRNLGDRPIQVGSHFHFFEVNKALEFPRDRAFLMRLDIPAGTSARFEPGVEKEVRLVAFGGKMKVRGHNGLTAPEGLEASLERARKGGFGGA